MTAPTHFRVELADDDTYLPAEDPLRGQLKRCLEALNGCRDALFGLTGKDSAELRSVIAETTVLVDSHTGPTSLFDPEECSLALIRRYDLSERHAEALRFVLQGFCIKDVCAATGKSVRYAKYGRERMYMKLNVRDGLAGLLVLLASPEGTQVTESIQPATSEEDAHDH